MKKAYQKPMMVVIPCRQPRLLAGSSYNMFRVNSNGNVYIDYQNAGRFAIIDDAI